MPEVLTPDVKADYYSLKDWQKGYDSQPNEYDYQIEDIEGQIPQDLNGTLYRNGPGLLDIHGVPIAHPFDGDGMIAAFSFKKGTCHFRNRFVKTRAYLEEQQAGEMLYRGVFGTQKPGGIFTNMFDIKLKNIANTNVIQLGDRLLALWEAAEPHALSPDSLDTIGLDYLEGVLSEGDAFSAHPRLDPASKFNHNKPSYVNFGIKVGPVSVITIYEFDLSGALIQQYSYNLDGFCFIHDFVITPDYCIFFQNPVNYNPLPFFFGLKGAAECLDFDKSKPTKIIVIPRNAPHKDVKVIEADAGFIFHHVNAYEQDQEIIVDSIAYEALTVISPEAGYKEVDFRTLSPGQLWRFRLNLQEQTIEKQQIDTRTTEFPVVNPERVGRKHRYVFISTAHDANENGPLQAQMKLDHETGQQQIFSFAPKGFAGEPIFVPRKDPQSEDDGWVLNLIYDAQHHRSNLIIFDGKDISQPVAKLHLKHHIPYGLHGNWVGAR